MTTIVTRAGKGSPLTNVEVDANFTNLNNDKIEKTGGTITANSSSAALTITQTGSGNALVVEDAASDTTPFVIDRAGQVYVSCSSAAVVAAPEALSISSNEVTVAQNLLGLAYRAENAFGPTQEFYKARGTNSAPTIAANGDQLGVIRSWGHDGSTYKIGSQIAAYVDGTPGTNDMPGRLVFSTTPDGSATPVERMRIDSAGNVGIGTTPSAGTALHVAKATGAADSRGVYVALTVQPDVTDWRSFASFTNVSATTGLTVLYHYRAQQGTIFTGGSVGTQYGYAAESNITGATNNYGFYGAIPAGKGRWNFYAAGTADNYFAGKSIFAGGIESTSGTVALGYGTGAGGAVTQATSKSTAVTLNKPTGQITMNNAALAAGASVVFTVNNSLVTTSDLVVVGGSNAGVDPINYRIETARANGNGAFAIRVTNISAGSLSEALQIQFSIIKGATA